MVNRGEVYHGFGELFAEKSQRLPVMAYLFLQDRSDIGVGGVGGVCSQGENSSTEGVGQGHRSIKGHLGGGESSFHGGCPGEGLGVT